MNFPDFEKKYTGQSNIGDTDTNKGQCVGLIEVWTDNLNLPHTWGNAIDLLNDADSNSFDVIKNTPDNFPLTGDVIVLGKPYGKGTDANGKTVYFGHTGIVVIADKDKMTLFEQNDPDGSTPHEQDYNYSACIGWLHPKTSQPPVQPQPDPLQHDLDQCRIDRDNHWNDLQTSKTTIKNLNQQINDRNNNITTLNAQIITLTTQLTSVQQEIDTLKPIAKQVSQLKKQLDQSESDRTSCLSTQTTLNKRIAGLQSALAAAKPQGFWNKLKFLIS